MTSPHAAVILGLLGLLVWQVPRAHAGSPYEIREVTKTPGNADNDLKFKFNQNTVFDAGSISRSAGEGAGAIFKDSAIPLAIFTLKRCTAVAPHIHPNAAETLFVMSGKIRIYQFRGEDDKTTVRKIDVLAGEAGYIQQGAYHMVENINGGITKFLQIFDHPFGGANFAAPALANLAAFGNANIVKSAFGTTNFPGPAAVKSDAIIPFTGCDW